MSPEVYQEAPETTSIENLTKREIYQYISTLSDEINIRKQTIGDLEHELVRRAWNGEQL